MGDLGKEIYYRIERGVRVISERLSRDLLEYASKPRFYALVAKVVFIYLKMLRDSSQRRS